MLGASFVSAFLFRQSYDLFAREYGEDVAALFGISRIAANDVTLKPSLLGIEVKVKEGVSPAETAPAGK